MEPRPRTLSLPLRLETPVMVPQIVSRALTQVPRLTRVDKPVNQKREK